MKKIMFNDIYVLTQAVLEGRKTMTRRIITDKDEIDAMVYARGSVEKKMEYLLGKSRYKLGEVVAVAQPYKDLKLSYIPHIDEPDFKTCTKHAPQWGNPRGMKGWCNKMFVRADVMPHQIQITDIKVKRLQDISDEDCLREGIQAFDTPVGKVFVAGGVYVGQDARLKIAKGMINLAKPFKTPQGAFAVLIDRVSGKGTWVSNPWVFAYSFNKIK